MITLGFTKNKIKIHIMAIKICYIAKREGHVPSLFFPSLSLVKMMDTLGRNNRVLEDHACVWYTRG